MTAWMENPKNQLRAALFIWTYDLIRFFVLFDTLQAYNINPWVFFVLDMVTVPGYVKGWTRLIGSLNQKVQDVGTIVQWSLITFFSSTAPYLYSAWAGRQSFPMFGWLILIIVTVFPLVSIIKKISFKPKNNKDLPSGYL
ncbi:MAG: hypothetical protein KKE62_11945 [Proteobacteria bacterium]|nr:hypothetical protein [Pseudomonadota bacterium]MBU1388990.1 hypothetical protein [Pseudomonadota bacterium]MBU1543542.1 hypothetical protein [Pseudomonadota bacterium]MBU2480656.1 hypothetical protein [Pseudomonadota bacterium]